MSELKNYKDVNRKGKLFKYFFLVGMLVFLVCVIVLGQWLMSDKQKLDDYKELSKTYRESNTQKTDIDIQSETVKTLGGAQVLLGVNPDTVGFLEIADTDISYPVVQSADNTRYLNEDFYGAAEKSGCLFLDSACAFDKLNGDIFENSDNYIVYGHNMKTGLMFGDLKNFLSEDYCAERRIIQFNSNYKEYKFKLIYVCVVDSTVFKYYNRQNFLSGEDFNRYLNECMENARIDRGEETEYGTKLLTLTTCYGAVNGTQRLLIVAKLVD